MATAVLPASPTFPVGTSVSVYLASALTGGGVPSGTAEATETVAADGTLTFSGLDARTSYVAWALGKAVRFSTGEGSGSRPMFESGFEQGQVPTWNEATGKFTALSVRVTPDDPVDLVAKLEEARLAGGGDVVVPPGTYELTAATGPAIVATNVRLLISGGATITQAAGANLEAIVRSYDFDAQLAANTSSAEHDWTVQGGGAIDGNAANNTGTTKGLQVYSYRYTVQNLRITNCDSNGFQSFWNDTDVSTPDAQEAHVNDLWVSKCADTGIDFQGPHDSMFTNIVCARITGGDGIYFSGDATGTQVDGLHTWSTTAGYGIYCDTTVHFTNCVAEGGLLGQVYINASIVWTGGRVFDKDTFGSSAHKGFVFGPNGFGAMIDGVLIMECNEGAFDFTAGTGGNGRIRANIWQSRPAQSVIVGTPSDSVDFDLHVNFTNLSGVTGVAATDIFTKVAHGLSNGWRVQLRSISGGTGLATETTYYVVNKTTDTFQLSLTDGGAAVNFTTDVTTMIVTGYLGFSSTTKKRLHKTRGRVAATEVIGKAVQGKIEVLDEYGSSLGFLPLYSSIT